MGQPPVALPASQNCPTYLQVLMTQPSPMVYEAFAPGHGPLDLKCKHIFPCIFKLQLQRCHKLLIDKQAETRPLILKNVVEYLISNHYCKRPKLGWVPNSILFAALSPSRGVDILNWKLLTPGSVSWSSKSPSASKASVYSEAKNEESGPVH